MLAIFLGSHFSRGGVFFVETYHLMLDITSTFTQLNGWVKYTSSDNINNGNPNRL